MPESEKTIKPAALGGLAGGTKYVVQNIMFKFVLDFELKPGLWMYGSGDQRSDENAMKSASHELKGLMSWYSCNIRGLCFPLQALVDYKGFRVLAISILPINDETIIYGSSDAGRTVHSSSQEFNEKIDTAARILNLKPHYVNPTVQLSGPGDLEGHLGTDGKFYVLDAARTLPPEGPDENPEFREDRQVYYKLLRPEFVRKWNQPLCSDAFTSWQRYDPNRTENNLEVLKATKYLHERLIPEFAKRLDKMASAGTTFADENKTEGAVSESFRLNRESFAKKWAVIQDRRRTDKADFDAPPGINVNFVPVINPVFGNPLGGFSSASNSSSPTQDMTKRGKGLAASTSAATGKRPRGLSGSMSTPSPAMAPPGAAFNAMIDSKDVETSSKELDIILMNEEMHRIGLNLRHLGEVRAHVKSDPPRQRILIEMAARVIKDLLRAHLRHKMREVRVLSEEPFKEVVIKVFNFVLGRSIQSNSFWALVKTKLQRKYKSALSKNESEEADPMALCATMDMAVLFRRLEHLLGITLTDSAREELESYPDSFEFVDSDVAEIYPKVKHMQIVDHAEGMALFLTAQKQGVGRRERLRQLRLSCEKFARALTTLPDSFTTLYQWGLALIEEAQMTGSSFSAVRLYLRASEKFRSAVTINPQFQACFIKLGEAYIELARAAINAAQNKLPLALPELDDWEDSFREEVDTEFKTPPKSATKRYFIKATQAWDRGLALPDFFFEEVYQNILHLHSDAVLAREPNRVRSRQLFYGSAILCEVAYTALNEQLLTALNAQPTTAALAPAPTPAFAAASGSANKYTSSNNLDASKADSFRIAKQRSISNPDTGTLEPADSVSRRTHSSSHQYDSYELSTSTGIPMNNGNTSTSNVPTSPPRQIPGSASSSSAASGTITSSPSTNLVFSSGISVAVPAQASPSTTPRIKDVISVITPALKSRLQTTPSQILSSPYATGLGDEFAAMKPAATTSSPSTSSASITSSTPYQTVSATIAYPATAAGIPAATTSNATAAAPKEPELAVSNEISPTTPRAVVIPPLVLSSTPPKPALKPVGVGFVHAGVAVVKQANVSAPNSPSSDAIGRRALSASIETISLPASTWTGLSSSNPNMRPVAMAHSNSRPSTIVESEGSEDGDSSDSTSHSSSDNSSNSSTTASSIDEDDIHFNSARSERNRNELNSSLKRSTASNDTSPSSTSLGMKISIIGSSTASDEMQEGGGPEISVASSSAPVDSPLAQSRSAGNLYHQGMVQLETLPSSESIDNLVTPRKMRAALDAAPTPFRKPTLTDVPPSPPMPISNRKIGSLEDSDAPRVSSSANASSSGPGSSNSPLGLPRGRSFSIATSSGAGSPYPGANGRKHFALVTPLALSPSSSLLVSAQQSASASAGPATLRSVGLGVKSKTVTSNTNDSNSGGSQTVSSTQSPPQQQVTASTAIGQLNTIVAQPKPRRMRHSASVSSASSPPLPSPILSIAPTVSAGPTQLLTSKLHPTPQPTTSSTGQYYSGVAQEDEIQQLINLSSRQGPGANSNQPFSSPSSSQSLNRSPIDSSLDKNSSLSSKQSEYAGEGDSELDVSKSFGATFAIISEARFKPFLARSDSPPIPSTKPVDKAEELTYLKRILLDILAIWSDSLIQYASLKSAGDEMLYLAGAVKLRDVLALDASYLEIIQTKIIPELKYQARDNRRIHYVLAALHGVLHEHDPTNTQLVYDMGTSLHTYAQLHRLTPAKLELHQGEAAECFEEALNLDPSFADEMIHRALVVQGMLLEELLSIVEYSKAIELRTSQLWDGERINCVSLASCSSVQDITLAKIASLCPRIQRLDLTRCLKVTDRGLQLIAKSVPDLRWLNLCECPGITDAGLQYFFQGQQELGGGCKLEMINLKGGTGISDAAVTAISHHCPHLTHLDLDHCKITNNAAATLAQYPLSKLSYLSFAFCVKLEDSGLAEMVKTRRFALQTIKLNGCNMISDAGIELLVNNMPSLTELHLAQIYRISNVCIAEAFAKLPDLQVLDIRSCKGLTWDVFTSLPFDSALKQLFVKLDPAGRTTDDAQAVAVRRASKRAGMKSICSLVAPTLQVLDIAESNMPEEPLQELSHVLSHRITKLDLASCGALTDDIMATITPRIPHVTYLNLNGCFQLSSRTTCNIARHCTSLRELYLGKVGENREPHILELIQALPRLSKLDLSGNIYLTDIVLADISSKLPSLDYLNVSATKITDKGLRLVCENLVNLSSLSMAGCLGITNDSLSWIAKHCRSLKELNIGRCSITDQGIISLAEGVAILRSLNFDDLSLITDAALQHLLRLQDSLVEISLKYCSKITPDCKVWLLKNHPQLKIKVDPNTNSAFVKELVDTSASISATRATSLQNIELLIKSNQALSAATSNAEPSELQSKYERIRRPKSDSVPPTPVSVMETLSFADPAIERFTLAQLTSKDPATLNCNPECLELYLADEEFLRHFGMPKTEFAALLPWKKKQAKESLKLF